VGDWQSAAAVSAAEPEALQPPQPYFRPEPAVSYGLVGLLL